VFYTSLVNAGRVLIFSVFKKKKKIIFTRLKNCVTLSVSNISLIIGTFFILGTFFAIFTQPFNLIVSHNDIS
jgi:hypothetical protein